MKRPRLTTAAVIFNASSGFTAPNAANDAAARRHSALRGYSPVSAKFQSSNGLVYRLSVKGFGNAGEANALCASRKRAGGSCFVRSVAGDKPVFKP